MSVMQHISQASLKGELLERCAVSDERSSLDDNVQEAALRSLSLLEAPHLSDVLDASRVSYNPAMDGIQTGALFEQHSTRKIQDLERESQGLFTTLDQLLDLSAELSSLKEDSPLSERAKTLLAKLKEKGIDLWRGDGKKISREEIVEIKAAISAHIEKTRTRVQQVFAKMQMAVQDLMSVNDSVKRMVSESAQLARTISKNMRP